MPYVQLSAQDDQMNIFWRSNLPNDDLATPALGARPTLLIVSCVMMHIDALDSQFNDPVLASRYNILAFDAPGHGRTECALLNTRDQICRLDDYALAALILTGTGVTDGRNDPQFREAIYTMADLLVSSTDPDLLDKCGKQFFFLMFGEAQMSHAARDRYLEHYAERWHPKYCVTTLHTGRHILVRDPLSLDQTARVTVPMTILQGTLHTWLTAQMAYDFAAFFPNTTGGAGPNVEIFPGGGCGMMYVESDVFAGEINRRVIRHIDSAELVPVPSTLPSKGKARSRNEAMKAALTRLAEMEGRPDVMDRDSRSIYSFSLRAEDAVQDMNDTLLVPYLKMIRETGAFADEDEDQHAIANR